MTRAGRYGAWVLGLLLFAGCATLPPPEAGWAGRLAVQVDAHDSAPARSASSAFELRGDENRGELQLTSPLGSLVARARWQPGGVELQTADGTQHYASLDEMSQQAFGERLPMTALIHWLGGQPWPRAPAVARPGGFEQFGWSVDLTQYARRVRRRDARSAAADPRAGAPGAQSMSAPGRSQALIPQRAAQGSPVSATARPLRRARSDPRGGTACRARVSR